MYGLLRFGSSVRVVGEVGDCDDSERSNFARGLGMEERSWFVVQLGPFSC